MKRYTRRERQAICDALNVIYWKADKTVAHWMGAIGVAEVEDAIGVSIYWDREAEEFRIRD